MRNCLHVFYQVATLNFSCIPMKIPEMELLSLFDQKRAPKKLLSWERCDISEEALGIAFVYYAT